MNEQMEIRDAGEHVIVNPKTGELLDLRKSSTDALLEARDVLTDGERQVREIRRELDDELVHRADHEGRRSLTFADFKIDVSPPTEKVWDLNALEETLERLVTDGAISQLKAENCIRYEGKPVWVELKTLLSHPRTRHEIEACFEEVDARRYVKVSRRD